MYSFPRVQRGQVVGLLGGSFDPPHGGHVLISEVALSRFALDHVWWLVSPGNPLKSVGPAPMDKRIKAARELIDHPRIHATDIEAQMGTRYTARTLFKLRQSMPGVRFVWLMGADNLTQFHRWQHWRWIMDTTPIGVMARPGDRLHARMSKAANVYRHARIKARASQTLAHATAPAWCFVNLPMSQQSSTSIRANGGWPQ